MLATIRTKALGWTMTASLLASITLAGCQTAYYGDPDEGHRRTDEPCQVVDCSCPHYVVATEGYCDCTHQHSFHLRMVR